MTVKVKGRKIESKWLQLGVEGDNNVETVTFEIPRFSGKTDLADGIGYIVFSLENGDKGAITIFGENKRFDETTLYFDWLVGREVTAEPGKINVAIKISGLDDEMWHSEIAVFTVAKTIDYASPQAISFYSARALGEPALFTANPNTEPPITISERTFTVPPELQNIAVQNDENSETVKIVCPRYYDGNDLASYYFFLRTVNSEQTFSPVVLEPVVSAKEITLDWTLRPPITSYAGALSIQLQVTGAASLSDDTNFIWQTASTTVNIITQIAGEPVIPVEPDYLSDLVAQLMKYGRKPAIVIGTSNNTSGYNAKSVDYLCDGSNDAQVINNALNGLSGGGNVLLLEGNYYPSDTIAISHSGISLSGVNSSGTILHTSNSEGTALMSITAPNVAIKDIGISYTKGVTGISAQSAAGAFISNCNFKNCDYLPSVAADSPVTIEGCQFATKAGTTSDTSTACFINLQNTQNEMTGISRISNCSFLVSVTTAYDCVRVYQENSGVLLGKCNFYYSASIPRGTALRNYSVGSIVANNKFFNCNYAIVLSASSNSYGKNHIIDSNYIDYYYNGIVYPKDCLISGNRFVCEEGVDSFLADIACDDNNPGVIAGNYFHNGVKGNKYALGENYYYGTGNIAEEVNIGNSGNVNLTISPQIEGDKEAGTTISGKPIVINVPVTISATAKMDVAGDLNVNGTSTFNQATQFLKPVSFNDSVSVQETATLQGDVEARGAISLQNNAGSEQVRVETGDTGTAVKGKTVSFEADVTNVAKYASIENRSTVPALKDGQIFLEYALTDETPTDVFDNITLNGDLTVMGNTTLGTPLPIKSGGTGATTKEGILESIGGVPITRKVNGKALSGDIAIGPADIGSGTFPGDYTISGGLTVKGSMALTTPLPITSGGTGAATASAARGALGLGNTTGALPIENGGTGSTTASAALTALGGVPTTRKINGQDLSNDITIATDLSNLTAADIKAGTFPAGTFSFTNPVVGAVQYSNSDLTAGSSSLTTGKLYVVYE